MSPGTALAAPIDVTAPAVQDLIVLMSLLGSTAGDVLCRGCRAADTRECAAAAQPCCDDCRHELPAAKVLAAHHELTAAFDKAANTGGA